MGAQLFLIKNGIFLFHEAKFGVNLLTDIRNCNSFFYISQIVVGLENGLVI